VLNKGLRRTCECDSFYIDTHTVHKNVASFKQCNVFGGGKNYPAAQDDALSNSFSYE